MSEENLDLFAALEPACDHLPVGKRLFIGEWLVCPKCRQKLRRKDYKPEDTNG